MNVTAYDIAQRFIGMKEIPGADDNHAVLAMLKLDNQWPQSDEVPWCSAFTNYVCWLLRLPRSKSLLARSWLGVGQPIHISVAKPGFDLVVLSRGLHPAPATDLTAKGNVGFYANHLYDGNGDGKIFLLGGNQSDSVSIASYDISRVLGIRRLLELRPPWEEV